MDTPTAQDHWIRDEAALRAIFPPAKGLAVQKTLDHLDAHARAFIARAPFLCIGTQSPEGHADVSPRGDPKGFVQVLDDRTLLIPDRPGNNRFDTLTNILKNPATGLLFIVPGYDETLRVNGTARLTKDPALLTPHAVNGRVPALGIVVTVTEAYLHCAKAFRRSSLWDPAARQDRREMPSIVKMILDQTTGAPADPTEQQRLDDGLEQDYRDTMY